MSVRQRTISRAAVVDGRGLFTGAATSVTFLPAPVDHGIVLFRTDMVRRGGPARIPAEVQNVVRRARRTALRASGTAVETCEHVLSAVAAERIDNLRIEVSGPEMPMVDGSALPFVVALEAAGVEDQDAPRTVLRLSEPVSVRGDDASIEAWPTDRDGLLVTYELDYGAHTAIRPHAVTHALQRDEYVRTIAPARTFVLTAELKALQHQGLCRHLTSRELLVIGRHGPLGGMEYRFPDELARHKVLDIIGDLLLLGRPLSGRIHARRSGHALNQELVRELKRTMGGA